MKNSANNYLTLLTVIIKNTYKLKCMNISRARIILLARTLLVIGVVGLIAVEIYHRSENSAVNTTTRRIQEARSISANRIWSGQFGLSSSSFNSTSSGIIDIRDQYLKYPLGALSLSAVCFFLLWLTPTAKVDAVEKNEI